MERASVSGGVARAAARSVAMAFSLFSKVPMPQVDWAVANMRYMMAAFPLVGVVVGVGVLAWWWVSGALGLGSFACGVGLALVPLAITGGIHLDGFCDVADALSSHAEPARKREILKDPRVGAFAVMGVVAYLLASVAVLDEVARAVGVLGSQAQGLSGAVGAQGELSDPLGILCTAVWGLPRPVWALALVPVVSRCLSGVATLAFPKSSEHGMLAMFSESADVRHALALIVVELVVAGVALVWMAGAAGAAMLVVALACLGALRRVARVQFGGMSGDLAGWFLQVAELAMSACLMLALRLAAMGVAL